jgi:hypothetical protein
MDLWEAVRARHSVRSYTDRRIEGEPLTALQNEIAACNRESGMNIQLCLNEPTAFSGLIAHYGRFRNVRNYVALVGKRDGQFEEKCGYSWRADRFERRSWGLTPAGSPGHTVRARRPP